MTVINVLYPPEARMSNLASKLGQIGPKWDKSRTFKDLFYLKKSQSDPFWMPDLTSLSENQCDLEILEL